MIKLSSFILPDFATPRIHSAVIFSSRPREMVSLLFKDLRGVVEVVPWILSAD